VKFWPSIELFYNVVKTIKRYPHIIADKSTLSYRAKIKIHGTNAGVNITKDGSVTPYSRARKISSTDDNEGFAKWVETRQDEFVTCFELLQTKLKVDLEDITIFGEWCGPGIQSGTSINAIPSKIFAVFAIMNNATDEIISEPYTIRSCSWGIPGAITIPWFSNGDIFNIDFTSDLAKVESDINDKIVDIEKCDPWVKSEFGLQGPGEGLVFYPIDDRSVTNFTNLAFKAKGEKHRVVAKTKAVQSEAPSAKDCEDFAKMFLTLARTEQCIRSLNNGQYVVDIKQTGDFVKTIVTDIMKECSAELAESQLDKQQVKQATARLASLWYVAEARKI
jgi:hypothetical protein